MMKRRLGLYLSPYELAAGVYRILRRVTSRVVRGSTVATIVVAKALVDALAHRDRPKVSFDQLNDNRYHPYLLLALTGVGPVGCSPRDVPWAYKWMPLRVFVDKIRINWRTPSNGLVLSETTFGTNVVHIDRHYYSLPASEDRFFAPYFAHPKFYKAGLHRSAPGMRDRKRTIRIFFAGTLSDSVYCERFKFPILTRDRIFRHLLEKFECVIQAGKDGAGVKPILIVSTDDTRDIVEKHKLSLTDYVDTMSRSDFFICPPGWLMPHSHNLIEAMSVGTIPITNYPLYLRPPLTPDVNCLAFSTLQELENAINSALHMTPEQVQHLRSGVIAYYDEYLEPASFGKKLLERGPSISEVIVNDESGS